MSKKTRKPTPTIDLPKPDLPKPSTIGVRGRSAKPGCLGPKDCPK